MQLFRAVDETEMASIEANEGTFLPSPSIPQEKGFFYDLSSAADFADHWNVLTAVEYYVVSTEAPPEALAQGRPHGVAGEGPGVYLRTSELPLLAPARRVIR